MNYRHAFHAGNFADVFKHIVLVRILLHLREKPAPFRVIDTHAGPGLYDLAGEDANRTGEWREGFGRLASATPGPAAATLIAPYLAACGDATPDAAPRHYPGSPVIAARMLRPQDRLIACESEPAAAAALAGHLRAAAPRRRRAATLAGPVCGQPTMPPSGAASRGWAKALTADGWTALKAYVPPKERRGLVVIDPPYERPDDFARLADGVMAAHRRWAGGIYLLWYPVKDRQGPDLLARALGSIAPDRRLRAEIAVTVPRPQSAMAACGIIVINPPWKLGEELAVILPVLVDILGRDAGRFCTIDRLEHAAPAERAAR